MCILIMLVCD